MTDAQDEPEAIVGQVTGAPLRANDPLTLGEVFDAVTRCGTDKKAVRWLRKNPQPAHAFSEKRPVWPVSELWPTSSTSATATAAPSCDEAVPA